MTKLIKFKDLAAAIVVLLLALAVFLFSYGVKQNTFSTIGPGFMPRLVAVLLAIFGTFNLFDAIKKYKAEKAILSQEPESEPNAKKRTFYEFFTENLDWACAALILFYVFTVGELGFVISSCIYMFLQMLVLSVGKKRNWLLFVVLSILVPVAVFLIFTKGFYLMLPEGLLG